ncbi:dihydrodipicolinate reductase [Jannaschia pohangensis]|nr:dihydrodipicolinate reductase [Jannaschia pohangensis]
MIAVFLTFLLPTQALAFEPITNRDAFVNLLSDRALTRTGITLDVTPDGMIRGRAFGVRVSGEWQWRDGYFCRTLFHGPRDLGANCQLVQVNGNTLRFTLDKGAGDYADLSLR